jgi:hypothetical protein
MTHAELARMARDNLQAIAAAPSPPDKLREIVTAHQVVFALFPAKDVPRGFDLHMIKGKKLVEGASDEEIAALTTTAVPCESLVEAAAMERAFGDGRTPAH